MPARRLALAAVVTAAAIATGTSYAQAPAGDPRDCLRTVAGVDLQTATIRDMQAAMAAGRLTSAALVDTYQARIAAFDRSGPQLNAIRHLSETARDEAVALDAERRAGTVRGPLHGIPVLLKDNVATADQPTTAGSKALEGAVPERDATITARLREAGAIILGKANLSEFAAWVDLNAPPGWSSLGGQVVNAHDSSFSPSGSSSGSGVAASMAFAAATIGTETSGSILSPSDANGVVGVKTTVGAVSRAGILPLAPSFDVPGPMTRSVQDAADVLTAIAGPDPRDPETARAPVGRDLAAGLRPDALRGVTLAFSTGTRNGLRGERLALFDAGLERLRALGATVRGTDALDNQIVGITELGAIPNEFKSSLNRYLTQELPDAAANSLTDVVLYAKQHPEQYPFGTRLLDASEAQPGREELQTPGALPIRTATRALIEDALTETGADAIVTPGNAHANVGAAAGYPTVITPLGYTTNGQRPTGIGFLGRPFTEDRLLAYAGAFEQDAKVRTAPTELNEELVTPACGG